MLTSNPLARVPLILCVMLIGCATTAPRAARPSAAVGSGQPLAPPSLAALPELPRTAPTNAQRMHQALTLAQQVFAAQLPAAPDDRSCASLQAWVEQQVAPWVEKRRDAVADTRFQFGPAEAQQAADVVVERAVLGLLQEDTALELAGIPSPSELDEEPEIAAMFRDLIRGQAQPFVSSARDEYRHCVETGQHGADDLRRFGDFCRTRLSRLGPSDPKH
ncbi:MAG TPA: hypothetical protein VF331_16650 [Polyangiales bacterium]